MCGNPFRPWLGRYRREYDKIGWKSPRLWFLLNQMVGQVNPICAFLIGPPYSFEVTVVFGYWLSVIPSGASGRRLKESGPKRLSRLVGTTEASKAALIDVTAFADRCLGFFPRRVGPKGLRTPRRVRMTGSQGFLMWTHRGQPGRDKLSRGLIPIHMDGAIKDAGRRWTLSSIQSHAASERTRSGSDSNSLR